MLLDPTVAAQKYVEDCEVCCNPIEISAFFEEEKLVVFEAKDIEQ